MRHSGDLAPARSCSHVIIIIVFVIIHILLLLLQLLLLIIIIVITLSLLFWIVIMIPVIMIWFLPVAAAQVLRVDHAPREVWASANTIYCVVYVYIYIYIYDLFVYVYLYSVLFCFRGSLLLYCSEGSQRSGLSLTYNIIYIYDIQTSRIMY